MTRVLLPDQSLQVNDNFQNTTNVLIFEFKTLYSSTYYIKVIIQISNKRKKTLCLTGSNSFFFLIDSIIYCAISQSIKKILSNYNFCLATFDQQSSARFGEFLSKKRFREKPFYIGFERKKFIELILSKQKQSQRKKGSEAHMYGFYHHCATWSFHFLFASGIHVYTMSVYDPGGHNRQKLPLLAVIWIWQQRQRFLMMF